MNLTDHNAIIFLITISTNDKVQGPPFPIFDEEIYQLYDNFTIHHIHPKNILDIPDNLINNGYITLRENIYLLTK